MKELFRSGALDPLGNRTTLWPGPVPGLFYFSRAHLGGQAQAFAPNRSFPTHTPKPHGQTTWAIS
ncbi:hypothetical protein PH5382_02365 [Phaeobacter sp. CECT 5382]|nr:hypothetical protein PH5382_02365 [Phaeobacter sp. CECT 5382]